MRHISGHDQKGLTSTTSLQFLRLRVGDERVLLAVQDKRRTEHFGHELNVLEALLHQVAHEGPDLRLHYTPNRSVAGHQDHGPWLELGCEVAGGAGA